MDVVGGKVAKHTGLHITLGIDVRILASAGHAAIHHRTIIPKIYEQHCLAIAPAAQARPQIISLSGSRHEFGFRIPSHRDIHEVAAEKAPFFTHEIYEFVAGDDVVILFGLRGGVAKEHPPITKHVHGLHNPVEVTFSSPLICVFPVALNADRG